MERGGKVALAPATEPLGLSNDVLVAARGSPFFKELTDGLPAKHAWYGAPYLTVLYSTGPMFVSLQYLRLSTAERSKIVILPPALYRKGETRYFNHLRGSTWHGSDVHTVHAIVHSIQWIIEKKYMIAAFCLLFFAAVFTCRGSRRASRKYQNKKV
jgi:mannosyltransferase OCH1-like enzyme